MLIFDRGFARAKYVIKFLKVHRIPFLMRVCRNVGFKVNGVVKMLKQMDSTGFYPQILYHSTEQIRLHLYVVIDNRFDDSMYLISNRLIGLQIYSCYKRRMQIEQGFRDIKSCFGVWKPSAQETDKISHQSIMAVGNSHLRTALYHL